MYFLQRSDIDLSIFIGQEVTWIQNNQNATFVIDLERSNLQIECAWRLRHKTNGFVVASDDCRLAKDNFSYQDVEKQILGRQITDVFLFEPIADLIIEFDQEWLLEIFHNAVYFEGWSWSMYQDEDKNGDISFWTDPGGVLDYPISNPLVPKNTQ